MKFDSSTDYPFVKPASEGCQLLCQSETIKKEPIISEMIRSLVNKFRGKKASLLDLRFLITNSLDFSGFLPIEKLLSIKIKKIKRITIQNSTTKINININKEKDISSTFLEFHQNVVQ